MVYMDVCIGAIFVYIHVGWGFCMCRFHGRMIPTSCGSDWPGLVFCVCVFVLSKMRMLFRKEISLQSSYQLI